MSIKPNAEIRVHIAPSEHPTDRPTVVPGRPRRHEPTTPLQLLPPIGGAWTSKTLTQAEDCVLALMTLDPRLTLKGRRDVLRLLTALISEDFDAHKVGKAASRLGEYHAKGLLGGGVFDKLQPSQPGMRPIWSDPDHAVATGVVSELLARYGVAPQPAGDLLRKALRLVGVVEPAARPQMRRPMRS
jgi:hypothetical protein